MTAKESQRRYVRPAPVDKERRGYVYPRQDPGTVTNRQLEYLSLLARGMTYRAVARHTGRGISSVKNGMTRAMRSLGVSTTLEAVAILVQRGEIRVLDPIRPTHQAGAAPQSIYLRPTPPGDSPHSFRNRWEWSPTRVGPEDVRYIRADLVDE